MKAKVDWLLVSLFAVGAFGLVVLQNWMDRRSTPFSPHQRMMEMEVEYINCKVNAPEGFDCIMVPLLVSEQYIKEYTAVK